MPSSRHSSRRLAALVLDSGSPAAIACDYCVRSNKACLVSSPSRRCSECLYRNRGCSRSHPSPLDDISFLTQEVALRAELDVYLRLALQCLARIDSLLANRDSSDESLSSGNP